MDKSTFDLLREIREYVSEEAEREISKRWKDSYKSPETSELNKALAKAQGEFPKLSYNRIAPYFQKEYADLDIILRQILPVLSANQIAFSQWTELGEGDKTILHTEIMHSSGQSKESRARVLPPKNDPLSFTSTINQIKRTQAMSLLGLTIADDPTDDNAEIQMADDRLIAAKGTGAPTLYNPRERSTECISRDQLELLEKALQSCPDFIEEIFKGANIQSLADLPRNKFEYTYDKIKKITEVRAGRRPNPN